MKLKQLSNLTFGEFIDLENIITKDNNVIQVCEYLFEGEGDVGDIRLDLLLGAIESYRKFRGEIYDKYNNIFSYSKDDEDADEINNRMLERYGIKPSEYELDEDDDKKESENDKEWQRVWGWYSIADNLAGGDYLKINEVFKRPLISVLNHLTFKMHN